MLSYKRQLLAGLALVLIGVLVGGYLLFRSAVEDAVLQQTRKAAEEQLKTAAYALRHAEQGSVEERLHALGRRSNARLSLIDAEGRILVDTAFSASESGEAKGEMPEIEEASRGVTGHSIRYSPRVHLVFLFVAREVEGIGGVEKGYLRLGKAYGPLRDRIAERTYRFLGLIGIGLVLLLPAYSFLHRRLSRELDRITREVETIGSHAGHTSHATLSEFSPLIKSINKISQQTRDYLEQLSVQRDEGEAIFNGLADGVAVIDSAGRIRRYNRAMTEIVRSRQDLSGRLPIECIPSTELQDAVEEMLESQKADSGRSLYVTFYNQSHFEAVLLPIVFEQSRAMEVMLVLHDVTDLKRLEQARKDFVANISHELRTPITSIKGYTETLLHSPPKEGQALSSFLRVVEKNVENLERLVDNLVHLSRAEAAEDSEGALTEEVGLSQVLDAAWQVCAPLAQRKGVGLDQRVPETEEPFVLGNKEQLIRVVLNLLDNAIKYSPEGGRIEVRIQDLGDQWQVVVEDEGPGVSPGLQSRVFERFYRGETGRTGVVGGTGLGLSICKHILQRHRGEITVESPVPGGVEGARFAFSLAKHRPLTEPSGEGTSP